ncbi:hypothetical protein B0H19DRAFT_1082075 [Mycena capillaripes]|nr:hypothetical protein B0H19DRAFT_1082075 [Mycena capillaripes]
MLSRGILPQVIAECSGLVLAATLFGRLLQGSERRQSPSLKTSPLPIPEYLVALRAATTFGRVQMRSSLASAEVKLRVLPIYSTKPDSYLQSYVTANERRKHLDQTTKYNTDTAIVQVV